MNRFAKQTMQIMGVFTIAMLSFVFPQDAKAEEYPRLANIFLKSPLTTDEVSQLAKWDLLILSPQTEHNSKAQLKQLQVLNPDIKLLVYIPSEEFPITSYLDWEKDPNGIWHKMRSGITDDMWIYDANGKHVTFWQDNWMLNPNAGWGSYIASFIAKEFFAPTDVWDGVFFDNVWTDISWIDDGIDLNRDGKVDSDATIRSTWQTGMGHLFDETRKAVGKKIIIVGNGDKGYYDKINGIFFENFAQDISTRWAEKMEQYKASARTHQKEQTPILNNTTLDTGARYDYRNVRLGLTSALLENGYYAFDLGSSGHDQIWWYDEYNIDLGTPTDEAVSRKGYTTYQPDVWRRDFSNGVSIVNSTNIPKTVDLGGEFEKIHGTQDPKVNNGEIVTEVSIDGLDGLILLKTFEGLDDILFTNGDFARFFRPDGSRVRNGFFVFDEAYDGQTQIAHIDLDNNGKRDLLLVQGPKIMAWRDDGQLLLRLYPYTALYPGILRVATGDLNGDGNHEIYVGPSGGYTFPIKVYTRNGIQMKTDWQPFGADYDGGYTFAIREVAGKNNNQLIIGTGDGHAPIVHVFNQYYTFQTAWLPYPISVKGGVHVATGDLDGDGTDEIVTGPGEGSKPLIHVYDGAGNALYTEFEAYSAFGTPGIDVRVIDVDFDGRDDIIGLSSGF